MAITNKQKQMIAIMSIVLIVTVLWFRFRPELPPPPPPPPIVLEDFTTYTEVDPTNKVSVTSNKITVTNLETTSSTYVYKDKGVGYFSDFTVEAKMALGSTTTLHGSVLVSFWNKIGTISSLISAGETGLRFILYKSTSTSPQVAMTEYYLGTEYEVRTSITMSYDVPYQFVLSKTGATASLTISDSSGVIGTLSLQLHSASAYQYIYAHQTIGGTTSRTVSGFVENIKITKE